MVDTMLNDRKPVSETLYGDIKTNILAQAPEPETDINVKRGLTWAISGIVLGAICGLFWYVYLLFTPIEGTQDVGNGLIDLVVVPVIGILYTLIGAVVGGCIGMSIGIVFMGIAAYHDYRNSQEEEGDEEEYVNRGTSGHVRGIY